MTALSGVVVAGCLFGLGVVGRVIYLVVSC